MVPRVTEPIVADMPLPLVPQVDSEQIARARAVFDRALEERAGPPMTGDE